MTSEAEGRAGQYRSRLSAAIHETAEGLHDIGLLDEGTMREFDASCLTPDVPVPTPPPSGAKPG